MSKSIYLPPSLSLSSITPRHQFFLLRSRIAQESVQALASRLQPNDPIPLEFVQMENEQPGGTTFSDPDSRPRVPIIDLGGSGPDRARVTEAIVAASQECGTFQVVNHGIPADVVAEMQRVGREFFELPLEEKELPAWDPKTGSMQGFGTKFYRVENAKGEWGDFLFHNLWPPSCVDYAYWPKKPSSYRKANEEYTKHLIGVMEKIVESLSLGLGLEGSTLRNALGGEDLRLQLKINYYPPCPQPDLAIGAVAHTDMSHLTILLPEDVPGLQHFRDDIWFDVDFVPGALIVHIGEQIEILSNGKYKSALHRAAVNNEKARFSWPVFFDPPPEKIIGPLPQLANEQNPAKYKAKMYKDYQFSKVNNLPM